MKNFTLTRLTETFGLYPKSIYSKVKEEGTEEFLKSAKINYKKEEKGETFKYTFDLTLHNAKRLLNSCDLIPKLDKNRENLANYQAYLMRIIKEEKEKLKQIVKVTDKETVEKEIERLYEQDELIKSSGLPLSEILRLAQKVKESETISYSVSGNKIDIKAEIENIKFYGGTTTITLKKTEEK